MERKECSDAVRAIGCGPFASASGTSLYPCTQRIASVRGGRYGFSSGGDGHRGGSRPVQLGDLPVHQLCDVASLSWFKWFISSLWITNFGSFVSI